VDILEPTIEVDHKGGKMHIKDRMPFIDNAEQYVIQYIGIWRVMVQKIKEFNAQSVLEFGTREGYSTQIFSEALKETGGSIVTVDKDLPKDVKKLTDLGNVKCVQRKVEEMTPAPVDILYIDDWHNPWHLYYELNVFGKLAKCVMIHDVCLEAGNHMSLLRAIEEWCIQNMVIWTIYPVNQCGLAVLEIEKSRNFHQERYEKTGNEEVPPPLETEWMHKLPDDIKPEVRHEPGEGL